MFKSFVNDLPDFLASSDDPVIMDTYPLNCLLYADDLILKSSSEKGLQNCIDNLM